MCGKRCGTLVIVVVVVGSGTPSGLAPPTQSLYSLVSNFRKMMNFVVISDTSILLLGDQPSQNGKAKERTTVPRKSRRLTNSRWHHHVQGGGYDFAKFAHQVR